MDYQYLAYTENKKLVKGKVSAHSEQEAAGILEYGGYRVIRLKLLVPFLPMGKLFRPTKVKLKEIVMFSRQLALLLESGIDAVSSLELLQDQTANYGLKTVIGEIVSDIRGGASLSKALSKRPNIFPQMYHRTIEVGERGGNLKLVLRQMADYMERAELARKKVMASLRYPIIVFVIAIVVIVVLVTVVMPTFTTLYSSMGAKLPAITTLLLDGSAWLRRYGLYLIIAAAAAAGSGFAYIRTERGRFLWDTLLLGLPVLGRIILLNELSRCCRSISLLLNAGLPVPEAMILIIDSSTNKVVRQALTEVQQDVLRGESLSQSMAKQPVFLHLMVAMVAVGEKSGNMVNTVTTAAQSFEAEAEDRTEAAVALLQPALTIFIAAVVGFIAIAMFSAMYGIYGQMGS